MKEELTNKYGMVFYSIEHRPEQKVLLSTWFGSYIPMEEVKKGATLGLDKIKNCQVSSIVNDNVKLNAALDTVNDWIAEVWLPQAISSGLRKFAHVVPKELFSEDSAQYVKDNIDVMYPDNFEMRLFSNKEDALKWTSN